MPCMAFGDPCDMAPPNLQPWSHCPPSHQPTYLPPSSVPPTTLPLGSLFACRPVLLPTRHTGQAQVLLTPPQDPTCTFIF